MFFLRKKSKKERKEEIYTKFVENKRISRRDLKFMRENDWHPIDELDLKPELINEIRSPEKKRVVKLKNPKIKSKKK